MWKASTTSIKQIAGVQQNLRHNGNLYSEHPGNVGESRLDMLLGRGGIWSERQTTSPALSVAATPTPLSQSQHGHQRAVSGTMMTTTALTTAASPPKTPSVLRGLQLHRCVRKRTSRLRPIAAMARHSWNWTPTMPATWTTTLE
jgi:hypothetical protein